MPKQEPEAATTSDKRPPRQHFLAVSTIAEDRAGLVSIVAKAVADAGCSIHDSHMRSLGNQFGMLMLVSGNWNTLSKLETALGKLEAKLGMRIIAERTEEAAIEALLLPYAVDVVALDQPGIVANLAEFFTSREIDISDLVTTSYAAAHTGTPMFSMHMAVHLPGNMQIATLRDEFMEFCDQLNLDAVMEPMKG